jgi:hypothetical protein
MRVRSHQAGIGNDVGRKYGRKTLPYVLVTQLVRFESHIHDPSIFIIISWPGRCIAANGESHTISTPNNDTLTT